MGRTLDDAGFVEAPFIAATISVEPRTFRLVRLIVTTEPPFNSLIEPGQWVRHPGQPGWGVGQVQSAIGERVTVNFEDRGKVVINARVVELEVLHR